jgi:hypothetical protein
VTLPSRVARNAKGAALVATRDIEAGEIVARFEGPIVGLDAVPEGEMPYALWLDGDRWMIPRSAARFINHSCDPNCTVEDIAGDPECFAVVARRPLRVGEEVTFAYNFVDAAEWAQHTHDPAYRFWHESWSFDCLCGAAECQGRIDGYRIVGGPEAAAMKT